MFSCGTIAGAQCVQVSRLPPASAQLAHEFPFSEPQS